MADRRPLLYLVDGSNALHRAFHAIRSLNNSKGFPTNAVYGFAAILRKLVREHKPTHVGIAFDVSESTARKEAYADYKAQRKPMADDLSVQGNDRDALPPRVRHPPGKRRSSPIHQHGGFLLCLPNADPWTQPANHTEVTRPPVHTDVRRRGVE